ncbi:uncharacterized protein LOC113351933 [Papaver somniferum]|uniref:uncharacterized protein LOC113351933 n=1 Tax=Papaver somniferum TaxID=3469 RepID=UPI000E6FD359|nr:uncharacterized protein LOC113351933 [Papaver somniferum]
MEKSQNTEMNSNPNSEVNPTIVDLDNTIEEIPSIDLINGTGERCVVWKFSLIGRLDLLRSKFADAVSNLKSQWKLVGQCKIIPLGKGFFTIKLDNERDQNYIKAGLWEVYNQTLWIRNWIPDFRPELHRTSSAMVWVHNPGLSLEYWDEQTLFKISSALGEPVKVDEDTLNFENGLYARVLIKIDLAKKIPHKLSSASQEKHEAATTNFRTKSTKQKKDKEKNSNINTSPRIEAQQEHVKFDIYYTPVQAIIQNTQIPQPTSINLSSGRFETLNTVIEEEVESNINEGSGILSPARIQQIAEDNAVEKSVINFIIGKHGSVSEERVPTTTWSKIIQKPSTSGTHPTPVMTKMEAPAKNMVIHNSLLNKKGNIWLFWNKNLPTPTVVSMSSQMITVNIGGNLISGVHAHVGAMQRRNLWSEMEVISDLKLPWLAIGDFNAFLTAEEKSGGGDPNTRNMLDFNNYLDKCELQQASKSGCEYSWSNCQHGAKRILCNLDRAVIKNLWVQKYTGWSYKVGLRIASDHSPLLGGCVSFPKPKNVPQKFQKIWIEHPNFMEVVTKCWYEKVEGDPACVFQSKLKKVLVE